jgi:UDP:flavonoid glycosyltransferase YjiC (YdhE family)
VRVLIASTRGTGHFNPLVPFVEAALRGGHQVLVAGPPPLAETVEAAGYPFWEGAAPPEDELAEVWERVPTVAPDEANRIVVGVIFGTLNVQAMLPRLRAACERWKPDLVVREQAEFASAIAAEEHGVPHARLGVSLAAAEEQYLAVAGPPLEQVRHGIVDRIRSSPYLTLFPASLEEPDATEPPHVIRVREPAPARAPQPLPDWWPGDDRPLVYVTFGSVAGTMPAATSLYRSALEAVAEVPARVLLTVGRETDVDAIGAPPPNVRVERWVAQADVLAEAVAVVGHGGSGTTLGALAAGLPQVVVPLFADQPENARRVAAIGAGLAVEPDPEAPPGPLRSTIDVASLRAAVAAVLEEPSYREAARAVAAELAALPPVDEALRLLLSDAR